LEEKLSPSYAVVTNFRIGIKTQKNNELLLKIPNIEDSSAASKYIGRKVIWSFGRNKIIGKIIEPHGQSGIVRARFRKGFPGDIIGEKLQVI